MSKISRQYIYLLIASIVLLIFVLLFSFLVLIPEGKKYRVKRVEVKKMSLEFRDYSNFHDETEDKLQELRSKNRRIITAFDKTFSPERFERENKGYFSKLTVSSISSPSNEKGFTLYEVNTTSQISSPKSFYNFLEAVNKSAYIIEVNFPIDFKRDGDSIKSSFTMNVYSNIKDTNATASESKKR
jgi:hypothetical protein